MKLLIAIPALDEETSITSIIERSLDARAVIVAGTPVTQVEVTVVSDGSTDRTVELASAFGDRIRLIVFEENRGYGAAITEAWRQSDAELVGFLDADGTCDPRFFVELVNELDESGADVVLGCRMHRASRMPALRRLGNLLFATVVSVFSFQRVRDVASGMRVVRRSSLSELFPLPSTLDFTPAMSARAIFSRDLSIREIDMPYSEREGESKLNPFVDGLRFLRVILRTILLYSPSRPLGLAGLGLIGAAAVMMISPTLYWLEHRSLLEWMIYRFLVAELFTTIGTLLLCAGHLGSKAAAISLSAEPERAAQRGVSAHFFASRWFWAVPAALVAGGVALIWDALVLYLRTGEVYEHWSRFVAMVAMLTLTALFLVTKILDYCLDLLAERLEYLRLEE